MTRKIISSLTNPSGILADRGRKLNSCPSYNPRSCRIDSFLWFLWFGRSCAINYRR